MGAQLLPDTNYTRRTDTATHVNLRRQPIPCMQLAAHQATQLTIAANAGSLASCGIACGMPPREFNVVQPDSPNSESEFDIAVIGGGVVELAVLRRFAMADLRCVLFEMGVAIISSASKGNS